MTLLGWSALSSLALEASAQSNSLIEALSYMNMSISVFAVATALIQLAGQWPGKEARGAVHMHNNDAVEDDLRKLAGQLRFAENKARLLALSERN